MISNFLTVAQQVSILFVLILIGFTASKAKLFDEHVAKGMTEIVLYLATPCIIIASFQRAFDPTLLAGLLSAVGSAFAIHILSIVFSRLIIHDKDLARQKVLQFGIVFSNCGFMSLPLQKAILGANGVFYGSAYVMVFNLLSWSYGLVLMSGDKKNLSLKKVLLNPGIMGVLVAVVLFVASVSLPEIILSPITYVSYLNTPLPMMIIGFHLASTKFSKVFSDLQMYPALILRLAIIPLLALGGMILCGVHGDILVSITIAASAPAAATTTLFAAKFNRDTKLSVSFVSASTVLSIISMPLIVGLAEMLK
ncbi:MAG: AEC family transporter [Bacillota bacterium]|nr:AEC family transporter [Bacillota bacterium]